MKDRNEGEFEEKEREREGKRGRKERNFRVPCGPDQTVPPKFYCKVL